MCQSHCNLLTAVLLLRTHARTHTHTHTHTHTRKAPCQTKLPCNTNTLVTLASCVCPPCCQLQLASGALFPTFETHTLHSTHKTQHTCNTCLCAGAPVLPPGVPLANGPEDVVGAAAAAIAAAGTGGTSMAPGGGVARESNATRAR